MELRVSIESEDAGADEICGITKIVTKLPFHLDGICTIVADSCCVSYESLAFTHIL